VTAEGPLGSAPGAAGDGASVVADLAGLAPEWGALADRTAAPPALHPGPVLAWIRAFGDLAGARAVVLRRGGELHGVLPLLLGPLGVSTVGSGHLEEVGVVAADDDAAAAVVARALAVPRMRLLLRPVEEGGPTHRALLRATGALGRPLLGRPVDRYELVDATADWEEYWQRRSRNTRSDIKRRRKRLAEAGELDIVVHDGTESLHADLDVIVEIEASGWKGDAGTALAAQPADRRFYREVAEWAAPRGWFRLALLRLDGRPIAFHYSLQAHGVLYALKIGYAGDMARFSPGKVLLASEIERAFREGLRRFDFAGSPAPYKTQWATGHRDLLEVTSFPGTPLGLAGQVAERTRLRAIPAAKSAREAVRRRRAARRDQPAGDPS
jgi:CelD/BcsL family acetyltransferase involved in cellulose biosynthesis